MLNEEEGEHFCWFMGISAAFVLGQNQNDNCWRRMLKVPLSWGDGREACRVTYRAHRAAVGEAQFGEPDDFIGPLVAHHVKVVFQRGVFGSLEVN